MSYSIQLWVLLVCHLVCHLVLPPRSWTKVYICLLYNLPYSQLHFLLSFLVVFVTFFVLVPVTNNNTIFFFLIPSLNSTHKPYFFSSSTSWCNLNLCWPLSFAIFLNSILLVHFNYFNSIVFHLFPSFVFHLFYFLLFS